MKRKEIKRKLLLSTMTGCILFVSIFCFKLFSNIYALNAEIDYYNQKIELLNSQNGDQDIGSKLIEVKEIQQKIVDQEKSIFYKKQLLDTKKDTYEQTEKFNQYIKKRIESFSIPPSERALYLRSLYTEYTDNSPESFVKESDYNVYRYPGYMNQLGLVWSDEVTTYQQFYATSNILKNPHEYPLGRYILLNHNYSDDRVFVYDCKNQRYLSEMINSVERIVVPSKDCVAYISNDSWAALNFGYKEVSFEDYERDTRIKIINLKDNYTIVVGKKGDGFYYNHIELLEDESGIIYTLKYLDGHEEKRMFKW